MKKRLLIIAAVVAVILVSVVNMYVKNKNDIRSDFENFLAKTFYPEAYAEVEKYAKERNQELLDYNNGYFKSVRVTTSGRDVIMTLNYRYELSDYDKKVLKEAAACLPAYLYQQLMLIQDSYTPDVKSLIYLFKDPSGYTYTVKSNKKQFERDSKIISNYIDSYDDSNLRCTYTANGTNVICEYTHDVTDISESDAEVMKEAISAYIELVHLREYCPEISSCTVIHKDKNGKEFHREISRPNEFELIVDAYVKMQGNDFLLDLDIPENAYFYTDSYGTTLTCAVSFDDIPLPNKGRASDCLLKLGFDNSDDFINMLENELRKQRKSCPQMHSLMFYLCDTSGYAFKRYYVGDVENFQLRGYASHQYERFDNCTLSCSAQGNYLIERFDYIDIDYNEENEIYEEFYDFQVAETNNYEDDLKSLREFFPELKGIIAEVYDKNGKSILFYEYN